MELCTKALLEQEILSDDGSHAAGSAELRGCDGQVKQGEQEILHARDSVGQNSGATQWCPRPRFSDRIRNSRPTGAAVVLLRDESSIPAQDRVGGDDTSHSAQDPSPELLPADGEPTPLSVGQAERTAAQLFAKDSILLTEIID